MIIHQADLLRGMSRDFIKEFMDNTTKESHEQGHVFFREGDQAQHFYILIKGRVRLGTGETGQVVHMVDRPGEAFGWSSLVGRNAYSAMAECVGPTKVVKIERKVFERIVEKDPASGAVFFKRLAGTVGARLINSYHSMVLVQPSEDHRTYGSSLALQQSGDESHEPTESVQ
jgi:CRP-like cAMP-binding protein